MNSIKKLLYFVTALFVCCYCTPPETGSSGSRVKDEDSSASESPSQKKAGENECVLFLLHVDNRAVVMVNDSVVFDTGLVKGGPYEGEINLTDLILDDKTDLKVELYNNEEMDIGLKPGWMIVYDVYVGDELIYFANEKRNETREGLVFTETHDLSGYLD